MLMSWPLSIFGVVIARLSLGPFIDLNHWFGVSKESLKNGRDWKVEGTDSVFEQLIGFAY
jgi:hypothetical protein